MPSSSHGKQPTPHYNHLYVEIKGPVRLHPRSNFCTTEFFLQGGRPRKSPTLRPKPVRLPPITAALGAGPSRGVRSGIKSGYCQLNSPGAPTATFGGPPHPLRLGREQSAPAAHGRRSGRGQQPPRSRWRRIPQSQNLTSLRHLGRRKGIERKYTQRMLGYELLRPAHCGHVTRNLLNPPLPRGRRAIT